MATLDELLVRIDASTELLRRELKKGEGQVADFERTTGRTLDKADKRWATLGRGIKTALGVLGIGLSIRGVQQAIASSVRFGDALNDASNAANVSAESLQELRFAFSQLGGVTEEQTDNALQRFTKTLGNAANGATSSMRVFESLGIEIRDVGGAVRENEEVLDEALRSLAAIENDAVRAARAAELFGREAGPELAAALSQGIEAVDKLRADVPGVLSNENVRLAAALGDEFERIGKVMSGTMHNAVIGMTADLADLFGLLDERTDQMLLVAELEHTIRALERSEARGRREPALPGRRQQLEEARRQLQIMDAQAAGVGGFATSSFLNGPPQQPIGTGVPFEEGGDIVAEFAALERERSQAASLFETELEKQKRLALEILETQQATAAAEQEHVLSAQDKVKAATEELALAQQEKREAALREVKEQNEELALAMQEPWNDFGRSVGHAFEDTLADAFLGVETNFGDMLRRMAAQLAASAVLRFVAGSIGGPFGAFLSGGIGTRAEGGPVSAGMPYVVGEKRPEIFVPNVSGRILPSAAGGGVVVHQHIHFDTALEAVDARIYRAAPMIARATEAKINESRARGR